MKDTLPTNPVILVPLDCHTLNRWHAQRLHRLVKPLFKPGLKLALACPEVQRADSDGVQALLRLAQEVRSLGGELKLCQLSPALRALFQALRLHHTIEIYNSTAEVERAFSLEC